MFRYHPDGLSLCVGGRYFNDVKKSKMLYGLDLTVNGVPYYCEFSVPYIAIKGRQRTGDIFHDLNKQMCDAYMEILHRNGLLSGILEHESLEHYVERNVNYYSMAFVHPNSKKDIFNHNKYPKLS